MAYMHDPPEDPKVTWTRTPDGVVKRTTTTEPEPNEQKRRAEHYTQCADETTDPDLRTGYKLLAKQALAERAP